MATLITLGNEDRARRDDAHPPVPACGCKMQGGWRCRIHRGAACIACGPVPDGEIETNGEHDESRRSYLHTTCGAQWEASPVMEGY